MRDLCRAPFGLFRKADKRRAAMIDRENIQCIAKSGGLSSRPAMHR
jgi:hypothetical protein